MTKQVKVKKKPESKVDILTRKDSKTDLAKAIELRSKGLTLQDIGNHFGVTKQSIHELFKRHVPYLEVVKEIRNSRADLLTAKGVELLLSLTPDEIKRMPPGSRATAFGIFYDKERLEMEKSTENIAVLTSTLKGIDRELEDLDRQLGAEV